MPIIIFEISLFSGEGDRLNGNRVIVKKSATTHCEYAGFYGLI